ncbi:MAG: DUF5106 domain-containing protein [Bacteroidales bacterium]|nr:DUF5106 domain-containing protein [Candidatus Sodaliphilus aphodohippi]
MKRVLTFLVSMILTVSAFNVLAQDTEPPAAPKTPFPYPIAPDTCSTLMSRYNYVVTNFWNNYDITKPIANDKDFVTAFHDYINFFVNAEKMIVLTSIRDFMFKARSNTPNLLKIAGVAEDALYGPNAVFWSDEVYTAFAQSIVESTAIKNDVRNHFKHQIEVIKACPEGNEIPDFEMNTANGKVKLSSISAPTYIIFFTNGGSSSSIDRLRLSTDVILNAMITEEKVKVIQVYIGKPDSEWFASQPSNWLNASTTQVDNLLDIRWLPSCYILDKDRKIQQKNVTAEEIKAAIN